MDILQPRTAPSCCRNHAAFAHNFPMRKYPHAQISGCMRNLFADALLFYNLPGLQTPNDTYYRRVEVVKSFLPSSFAARTDRWSASYSPAQSDDRRRPPFATPCLSNIT